MVNDPRELKLYISDSNSNWQVIVEERNCFVGDKIVFKF